MSFIDNLLAVLVPHDCVGCGADGSLLCFDCIKYLPLVPEQRYLSSGARLLSACTYEGIAKNLVWRLKFGSAQEAAKVMATQMIKFIHSPDASVVPVPTATSRVRQRGYDQAKLLARALSRQTGLPYLNCLARHGQAHQRGAHRQERLDQLHKAYRIKKHVNGLHIILIDDVTTTGATLEMAAETLYNAGAAQVEALTFAQA